MRLFLIVCFVAWPLIGRSQSAAQTTDVIAALGENLAVIRTYVQELETADESGSWGRDQGEIQEDLDELLDTILSIILGDEYPDARERLFALESRIDAIQVETDQLRIARLDARPSPQELSLLDRAMMREFAPGSIEDIDARIAKLADELAQKMSDRDTLVRDFRSMLASEYDIELTQDQVRSVLYQINGSSIVEATVTFAVLQQIEARFAEIRATAAGDETLRRYYGMAAALRLVVARLHVRHFNQYSQDWIPAIDDLAANQRGLIAETEMAILDPANAPRKSAYENNLDIQRQVQDVIEDYRGLLIERRDIVRDRLTEAEADAALAVNTLKTLENAAILFDQFSWTNEEFEALSSIRNSDLIPLDDAEVTENYLDLSRQLQGS